MTMTPQQWAGTCQYLGEVFGRTGPRDGRIGTVLETLPQLRKEAGLPDIAISGDVGRLLTVLTTLATRTPEATGRIVEVGTLGGYSALWLVRGLGTSGRLFTVEQDPRHAAFARARFVQSGVSDRVELIEGGAMHALPRLADKLGPASVDVIFLDADKREYVDYLRVLKPMLRRGGLLLADNALGSNRWWITDDPGSLPPEAAASRAGADLFNHTVAADPDFETACVPIREGVLIATRIR